MFFKILALVLCVACAALFLGEFILRSFTLYGVEYFVRPNLKDWKETKDSTIPYRNIHNEKAFLGQLKRSIAEGRLSSRPQKRFKIMLLGDSIAMGGELKSGEPAFPQIIRETLQKEYPGVTFEVLVFGEGGYNTEVEVAGYGKYGKDFGPDMVILAYCHNDTAEMSPTIRRINGKVLLAYYKTSFFYFDRVPFNLQLGKISLFVRLINERLAGRFGVPLSFLNIRLCSLSRDNIYREFKKLRLLTSVNKTPVMVVVFPYLEEEDDWNRSWMARSIKEWCAELGFMNVDISLAFKEYGYSGLKCSPGDPVHPNALGHKIAAESIAGEVSGYYKAHRVIDGSIFQDVSASAKRN